MFLFVVGKLKVSNVQSYNFPFYFESVARFKYFGMILTKENCIYDEITNDLPQGMGAIIRPRFFCLPVRCPKNIKIK